ncbi:hypothetical protein MHYP_G00183590 [Metynnis hypsauchen]
MGITFFLRRNIFCCLFLLTWNTIEAQIRYSIPEELRGGSVVGNIAKDLGLDLSEVVDRKLRIASGSGKQYFSVSVEKGELIVNEKIDRESLCGQSVPCLLPLEAVVENPLQLHRVEIEIQDINDNAPNFNSNERTLNIPESINPGAKFLLDSADDPDVGTNSLQSYSLDRNKYFVLNVKTQDGIKIPELVLDKPLDREKQAVHKLILTAVDGGNPVRSGTCEITIVVLDNNDNAPQFEKSFYEVTIDENTQIGSNIVKVSAVDLDEGPNGEVEYVFTDKTSDALRAAFDINSKTAHDPDLDQNAKISYSILDSKVQDVSISSYIYINSDNGSIYTMHSFDYEKMKVFQIQVQAKDHGSPSLSSNATVHVFILDQNDNAPAVIYPSAVLGSVSHQRMPRSAKAGHLVTKVTAVDADSGHNAWISYRLAEATDASLFSVNLHTGEVRTKRSVSEQDDSSQRLLIEIRDNGEPVQSTTVTVDVLIEDGFHEPVSDYRKKSAEISKKSGKITLYLIISLASVSLLCLMTFFILLVKCARGSRGSSSCCIRRSESGYKNPNRNLQIQLNTDGPIKYVEVLGGDMMSQSQSFGSYLSPLSEFSDFTLVKPSSTTDFTDTLNVLDASLPDSTWKFESQQVSR